MREGSNEDEEEDLDDRDEDVKQSYLEEQSTSSSNPRYEKVDGASTAGETGSSSDHLVDSDSNKAPNTSTLMAPTTIQVNITRDSQDTEEDEENVEATT